MKAHSLELFLVFLLHVSVSIDAYVTTGISL